MNAPAPRAVDMNRPPSAERWAEVDRWAPDVLITFAFATVLGALSISAAQGIVWQTGWAVLLILAFVLLHLSVAARTRAPVLSYSLASLAMVVIVFAPAGRVTHPASGGLVHLPALFLPSSLVFLFVLHGAAARLGAVLGRVALLAALVGAVIATGRVADALRDVTASGWLRLYVGLGFVVTVLATWSLGRLTFARRQRSATERVENTRVAVLEERARIAREMHDIVAHSLAVIVRQAEGGAFIAQRQPERAERALRTIADTGRAALTDMRGVLGVLRSPDGVSEPAPQPTLADLPPLVSGMRATGVAAELTEVGTPFEVGSATELAAYRLVQEGLTNAVKYAGPAARVQVTVRWQPADVAVEVTDDGGVQGTQPPVPGAGAGLQGLRERVSAVGGNFRAERLERGFQVGASFPRPSTNGSR